MRYLSASPARRGLRAAIGLCLLALLAACGSANTVDVSFKGYSIVPSRASIKAGDVTFQVKNEEGQVLHQFVVVRTDLPADQLPLDADGNVDWSGLNVAGKVDKIDVGQSAVLAASLAAGHYALICNVPSHYKLGMHTDFTVSP